MNPTGELRPAMKSHHDANAGPQEEQAEIPIPGKPRENHDGK
jgi:hypothetical protein